MGYSGRCPEPRHLLKKVDTDEGHGSLYNRLTINSDTEATGDTRLLIGGNATVQGILNATSLNLSTNTSGSTDGKIVAKNIEATAEISANKLKINDKTLVNTEKVLLDAPQVILQADADHQLILDSTGVITKGFTKLANTIKIDTEGNITDIKELTASGKIQAQKFNATSDARKKTNIEDYSCSKSILDLPIKSFEYLADDSHTKYIGCLAQDLQKICPEIVDVDKDGFLSIQETKLVYLLLQEVRNLKKQLEHLKGE